MGEQVFRSVAAAVRAIDRDLKALGKRANTALRKAARGTRNYIARETVPRAFGELADSGHVVDTATGAQVIFDAPHAAAVEVGSRPHTPPLEPLVAWVMLRGLQGLTAGGRVKKNRSRYGVMKDWRKESARVVGEMLHQRLGTKGAASWRGHAQSAVRSMHQGTLGKIDNPEAVAVARAIQAKIAKRGTKPFRYVGSAMGEARAQLDRFVSDALRSKS